MIDMDTIRTEKIKNFGYRFEQALLDMDRVAIHTLVKSFDDNVVFIEEILIPCLEKLGTAWGKGELALAQVYIGGQICEEVLTTLSAADPSNTLRRRKGSTHNIGIVLLEDFHTLGKLIVNSTLAAAGFNIIDLGRLTVEETFARVVEEKLDILLISVLMLPSALRVKNLSELFTQKGVSVKIVVGGAPFRLDDNLWRDVCADAMGRTSTDALHIVERLVGEEG
jgi:methanogenic corrinoid protein MtbC1